jgi:hypothetical protein
MESLVTKSFDMVNVQCGLVSAMLVIGLAWTAWQLTKARASHESDREKWMVAAERRAAAFEAQATAQGDIRSLLTELRGLMTALLARNYTG